MALQTASLVRAHVGSTPGVEEGTQVDPSDLGWSPPWFWQDAGLWVPCSPLPPTNKLPKGAHSRGKMSHVWYFRNGHTVGRWGSRSPGEPGTDPESRADSENAPVCPPVLTLVVLPSWGLGAADPWLLPPPRASSIGLPPPRQHPRLRRGKRIYFWPENVRLTLLNRARASVIPVTSILRFLLPREPRGTSACTHVVTSGKPQVTLPGLEKVLWTQMAPKCLQTQHWRTRAYMRLSQGQTSMQEDFCTLGTTPSDLQGLKE